MENEERDENAVGDLEARSIRIMKSRCATCIYRPGNRMYLTPGRVADMTQEAESKQGHVVCHDTLDTQDKGLPPSICKGFTQTQAFHASLAAAFLRARIARALLVDPDTGEQAPAPDWQP